MQAVSVPNIFAAPAFSQLVSDGQCLRIAHSHGLLNSTCDLEGAR
jgi:hypothetical protein